MMKQRKDEVGVVDFLVYEKVRESGETNMYDISRVIYLSDILGGNLSKVKIIFIMEHYMELKEKYLKGKKGEKRIGD